MPWRGTDDIADEDSRDAQPKSGTIVNMTSPKTALPTLRFAETTGRISLWPDLYAQGWYRIDVMGFKAKSRWCFQSLDFLVEEDRFGRCEALNSARSVRTLSNAAMYG